MIKRLILSLLLSAAFFPLGAQADKIVIPDPPKEHPRLYLRAEQLPEFKERVASAEGRKIIANLTKLGVDRTPEEEAQEDKSGFRYYFRMRGVTSRAQVDAIEYLASGDKDAARRAITGMLDTLKRTNYGFKNDMSRASGVMLMVGAIVYDWCYDQLTAEEKDAYVKEFVRIAGTMSCHYPPRRNESIAGHGSEWMILRDLLSAGIAIFDEYPDMFNYVRVMLQEDYIPVRNYTYQGLNYHQGTSYANLRLSADFVSLWILDRLGARDVYVPQMREVLYDFIYRRRPDGNVLPSGDTNHIRGQVDAYPLPMMLAASYWKDPYLALEWDLRPRLEPHCMIFELLWRDFSLYGKGPQMLPLSRYSPSPFGWMIARTGWGQESVIAEMKINEQFYGNHQHLDGGSFQIYYKGPLAIDSGLYESQQGGYNNPNNVCYTKRTIAHNSLLIDDPEEKFESYVYLKGQQYTVNDGGQRLVGPGWATCTSLKDLLSEEYTVGKTLAHGFGPSEKTPDYTYLKGDITRAYSAKVKEVRRSFVFFNLGNKRQPAAMVIYDHVVSADPAFKKTWLLHSIEEPTLFDGGFEVRRTKNGDSGMLRCETLLPAGARMEKVGGPGREFWVRGVNYPADPRPNRPDVAGERGAWRIELSPGAPAAEDCFLNVIRMADNNCKNFEALTRLEGEEVTGVIVAGRGVVFHKSLSQMAKKFTLVVPEDCSLLVTDLAAGKWKVSCNGKTLVKGQNVTAEEGVLYIEEAPAGKYVFTCSL